MRLLLVVLTKRPGCSKLRARKSKQRTGIAGDAHQAPAYLVVQAAIREVELSEVDPMYKASQ